MGYTDRDKLVAAATLVEAAADSLETTRHLIRLILGFDPSPRQPAVCLFILPYKGVQKGPNGMDSIPKGQFAECKLVALDVDGEVAPFEGGVAVIDTPDLADVGIENTTLRIIRKPGSSAKDGDGNYLPSTVQVKVDSKIGDGENFLVGTLQVIFPVGEATSLSLGPLILKPISDLP